MIRKMYPRSIKLESNGNLKLRKIPTENARMDNVYFDLPKYDIPAIVYNNENIEQTHTRYYASYTASDHTR